jgi:pyruvate-ferredoxin/flavodoxin oxidoreductase
MQGNAFLGAFFKVSSFLNDNAIGTEHFHKVVRAQYVKKFGRFGDAVVDSNMEVMTQGFDCVVEVPHGAVDAADDSLMRGSPLLPLNGASCNTCGEMKPDFDAMKAPIYSMEHFDGEFRAGLGYHQPASPLASVGMVASATGASASKRVSRRQTPVFIAENCTQCMECIAVCPDTAMPNTAQDIDVVLDAAIRNYVSDIKQRDLLLSKIADIEAGCRAKMLEEVKAKNATPFKDVVREIVGAMSDVDDAAKTELYGIVDILPMAYTKVNAIFSSREKKDPGAGGLFSIFINDLCKGCGECVHECGDKGALRMEPENEELSTQYAGAQAFFDLLPETSQAYLGLYDNESPADSKPAALRNHLMVRSNYEALVCGDGACAGCGEKTVLHSLDSITEALMRPVFHAKANRLDDKAERVASEGAAKLAKLKTDSPEDYRIFRRAVAHLIMGLGGEVPDDTTARIEAHGDISDEQVLDALTTVMRQDAVNHRDLRTIDGRLSNGMCVMAMGASTGCNSVYGSTPPNNPHPYPWMNSLFQDGATISWIMGESFIQDHARRSVIPERLADRLLDRDTDILPYQDYFDMVHMTDVIMTDQEIRELPKVWAVGGDGALGDIGFQNVSKVVLQNRPNVQIMMLDTQVYSNTGGQNSDSSPLPGGFDMNQFGEATEGKLTEMKNVAEILTVGHGSPFVAQVSMANAAKFYKALIDGVEYRGTAFYECFTACPTEHGTADDVSTLQAQRIRDSRGLPEFTFDSRKSEIYQECIDLKGNPQLDKDWWLTKYKSTKNPYHYTVAHWASTEARFRRHLKAIKPEDVAGKILLDDILLRITMDDVTHRRFLNPEHRSFIPDFETYIEVERPDGKIVPMALTKQMVIFCVERRKAWRQLQSRSGVVNNEYRAQQALLKKVDGGEIGLDEFRANTRALYEAELAELTEKKEPVGV